MPKSNLDVDKASDARSEHAEGITFAELGVPAPLVHVLAADDKTTAFPIQADTLGDSLAGRDILGRGRTGSGKTLAFSIPMVARLSEESATEIAMCDFEKAKRGRNKNMRGQVVMPHPRALVLAPTRELVNQIDEVIRPLAQAYGMTTSTIYGGVKQNRQVAELRAGADIVVACPGRLEDLLRQRLLSLESVQVTVLDEADEMADMGFLPAVTRLLEQVDPNGQSMLFSATLDHGVDKVVARFLKDAKVHAVDSADAQVDTMTHHVFAVSQGNKHEVIRELASGMGKRILFTRTKFQAKKMAKKLVQQGIPAVDLQGNLNQNQRDRNLAAFSSGEVRVMVATDVAARGIDVSDVTLVVQTEPPEDPKSFLHRSGRTARAGESGDVVTLVLPQQQREARSMMRRAGIRVKTQEVNPGDEILEELVGEHAPLVEGWTLTVPTVAKNSGRSGRSGRRRGDRRSDRRGNADSESMKRSGGRGRRRGERDARENRQEIFETENGRRSRGSERSRERFDRYERSGREQRQERATSSRNRHRDHDTSQFESGFGGRGKSRKTCDDQARTRRNHAGSSRKASGFRHSRSKKKSAPFRRAA